MDSEDAALFENIDADDDGTAYDDHADGGPLSPQSNDSMDTLHFVAPLSDTDEADADDMLRTTHPSSVVREVDGDGFEDAAVYGRRRDPYYLVSPLEAMYSQARTHARRLKRRARFDRISKETFEHEYVPRRIQRQWVDRDARSFLLSMPSKHMSDELLVRALTQTERDFTTLVPPHRLTPSILEVTVFANPHVLDSLPPNLVTVDLIVAGCTGVSMVRLRDPDEYRRVRSMCVSADNATHAVCRRPSTIRLRFLRTFGWGLMNVLLDLFYPALNSLAASAIQAPKAFELLWRPIVKLFDDAILMYRRGYHNLFLTILERSRNHMRERALGTAVDSAFGREWYALQSRTQVYAPVVTRRLQVHYFLLGTHPRAGASSLVRFLVEDVLEIICSVVIDADETAHAWPYVPSTRGDAF